MTDRAEISIELRDTQWPLDYIDHDRQIVRAIVVDGTGMYYFVRAVRDDEFGAATLIETSGGGVEPGEDLEEAVRRELREELGAQVEILRRIGVVSDAYNLIHRHNINRYFLCRMCALGERRLTEDEIEKYHLSTLRLSYAEAVAEYEARSNTRLGRLIADRELPILRRARALLEDERDARVWCFGDSNTYGFDPRAFSGGRCSDPWPELLAREAGFQVINDGVNGRVIPHREPEYRRFREDAGRYGADALAVMLGVNDLLNGASPREIAARMEDFLARCRLPKTLLIGPPPLRRGAWVPDDQLAEASRELSRRYRTLAERMGVGFADAGAWDIALAFDGVHFSSEGHARFARGIAPVLADFLAGDRRA